MRGLIPKKRLWKSCGISSLIDGSRPGEKFQGPRAILSALLFFPSMKTATAIVLAAGSGSRMGGGVPKVYQPLAGRPLLLRTVDRMFAANSVDGVIVVVADAEMGRCEALLRADLALRDRPWVLQRGGATRLQSAQRGLERLAGSCELVILHDAARPFVSPALIDLCVRVAAEKGAVIPGLPVRDTIKEVSSDGLVRATPDRSSLREIQTPQVFRREIILRAHEQAAREDVMATDDAMVVERAGFSVYVVEGERTNLKVTVPEDFWLAELMIREKRIP